MHRVCIPGPSSGVIRVTPSIFLEFTLPNAPTWFYMSAILLVAIFFKFNRILSLRNWDLITLLLLVPGLLLLQQEEMRGGTPNPRGLWWGYVWLLSGSAYFLYAAWSISRWSGGRRGAEFESQRFDLAHGRALCMLGRCSSGKPPGSDPQVGKGVAVVEEVQRRAADLVTQTAGEPIDGRGTLFWTERAVAGGCHLAVISG